jgi:hypothetical protein
MSWYEKAEALFLCGGYRFIDAVRVASSVRLAGCPPFYIEGWLRSPVIARRIEASGAESSNTISPPRRWTPSSSHSLSRSDLTGVAFILA